MNEYIYIYIYLHILRWNNYTTYRKYINFHMQSMQFRVVRKKWKCKQETLGVKCIEIYYVGIIYEIYIEIYYIGIYWDVMLIELNLITKSFS